MVDDEVKPAVIPMRSSNLSPARELNNLIKNLRFSDDKGSSILHLTQQFII